MSPNTGDWKTSDLELYLDEELDPQRHRDLNHALRQDPALRARLAAIRQRDALTEQALLQPGAEASSTAPGRTLSWHRLLPLAAAASIALVLTLAWQSISHRPAPPLDERFVRSASSTVPDPDYQAIRVVPWHLARREREQAAAAAGTQPGPPVVDRCGDESAEYGAYCATSDSITCRLNRALAAGQVDEALALLSRAPEDQRARGYRRIGTLLRSTLTATEVLDRLPPREQLEVCAGWARDRQLRQVAFLRLQQLLKDREVSQAVTPVAARLYSDPQLRGWVRSYLKMRF